MNHTDAIYADAYIVVEPSGERYAIRYRRDDGEIVRACGPLHYSEISRDGLENGFENEPDLVDWLMSEEFGGVGVKLTYRLLSDDEIHEHEA